jgi:hypothetical protein
LLTVISSVIGRVLKKLTASWYSDEAPPTVLSAMPILNNRLIEVIISPADQPKDMLAGSLCM